MPDPLWSETRGAGRYRILVVDDDPDIRRIVSFDLLKAGYEVFTAASGWEALAVIAQFGFPHLAIVDISMPEMDGFSFCQAVQQYSDLPMIFLSAASDEETVVRGLQQCAEDYVTKPFRLRELLARVERVLHRIGDWSYALEPIVRVDEHLAVDFAHQQAFVEGQPVALTPLETKLLYLLMRNAGRTVLSRFLLNRLWPNEDVLEERLRVHISNLRKKIEPIPSQPRYILTEHGAGYRFPAPHPQSE
jgi:DNA-binding response OmpR family regulator